MADEPRTGRPAPRRSPAGQAATAAVSIAAAFALTATGGMSAYAAPRPDYPTWAEVQAAKQNEAAKKAEIAKLEKLVKDLQAEADALAKVAMEKAEDALLAQGELQAAEAKTSRLADQLADAQKRADSSAKLAAALVARLARSGGSDASIMLAFSSEADGDRLLSRLGTMSKLTESSTALVEQAIFDKRTVESLAAEADVAKTERRARADAATQAQADAEHAASQVEAQVAAQSANRALMYAQLASLKGTTAAVEQEYAEGVAADKAQQEANQGGSGGSGGGTGGGTPGGGTPGGGTPGGGTPGGGTAPTPVAAAVEGAINYAKAQLGERYQLGGMGPDRWDCSGLTKASYASVGVYVGTHSSTDQYNYMARQGRLVPYSQAQPGDLLFYSDGGSASVARKYHVTIYLGGGKMIEAPNPSAPVRIVNVRNSDLVPFAGRPTG